MYSSKKKIILLFAAFFITLTTYAQVLVVFKSSDHSPSNEWTTWENIARPWFMAEFGIPFERMTIRVCNIPYGGSYDREINTTRQPGTWQWIEDLPTGKYDWFARFEYFDGHSWRWSDVCQGPNFYVDRTPPNTPGVSSGTFPTSSISSLTPWTSRSDLTFTWSNPGDAGSGVHHYELSYNGGGWQSVSSGYTPSLTSGTHSFSFRTVDNIGLRSGAITGYARVDYVPPSCAPNEAFGRATSSPDPAWTNTRTLRIRFNGSDAHSGIKFNYLSLDEEGYNSTILFEANVTVSDGPHTFDVKVMDEAGNYSSERRLYTRVDTEKPVVEITNALADTLINRDSLVLTWTGSDAPSGIKYYIVELDGGSNINVGHQTADTIRELSEGSHRLIVAAVDHAMNYTTDTLDVYVDLTAPVITSDHSDLQIPGDEWCFVTMENYIPEVIATDNFSEEIMIIQDPEPGMHIIGPENEVTLDAWDEAGNHSSVSFNIEVTDTIKPVASFSNDMDFILEESCSVVLPDYTDHLALDIIECSPYTVSQAPGPGSVITDTTQVTLTVTDEAGNTGQCSFDVNVIDESGPDITFITAQEVTLDETCSFILPDYTTDDELIVTDCSSFSVTQHPEAGATIHDSVTVILTAADEHGNSTQWNVSVNANDHIDPVIVCADDQEVRLESGESEYQVSGSEFDPEAYQDNCSAVTLTNNLNQSATLDGEVLQEGTTTITWTATDASGNSGSCSFDVTVSPAVGFAGNMTETVSVYPNPTSGTVIVECGTDIAGIDVTGIGGRTIMQIRDAGSRCEVDLSQFESGSYFLKIRSGETLFTRMVIRE